MLIAKLHAYSFSKDAHLIVLNYLSNIKQRVKINNTFSLWTELIQVVPQNSIRGHLLFNIYINDLFITLKNIDVCNFVGDINAWKVFVFGVILVRIFQHFEWIQIRIRTLFTQCTAQYAHNESLGKVSEWVEQNA